MARKLSKKKSGRELIRPAEYARRKGKCRSAISRGIKLGIIPTHDGLIDEQEADKAVAERLTPLKGGDSVSAMTFAQARTEHEKYKAALAKIEYEEKTGSVHAIDRCRREAFSEGRRIRDAMMAIPDRVSSILAAENDEARVNAALRQEIRAVLYEHAAG